MGQRQLADLGRHPTVVVDERDDASVERPLGALVHAADRLRVSLVLLADTARGAARTSHPRQAYKQKYMITLHLYSLTDLNMTLILDCKFILDITKYLLCKICFHSKKHP